LRFRTWPDEIDGNRELRENGFPVHQKRPVLPVLSHSTLGGLAQILRASDRSGIADRALSIHRDEHHNSVRTKQPQAIGRELRILFCEDVRFRRLLIHLNCRLFTAFPDQLDRQDGNQEQT